MNQAFGGNLSGNSFDYKEYIKTPSVIIRLISLIFSIIVFGCISNGGYMKDECLFNSNGNACRYGIGIGVIAFLACIAFLIGDAMFHQLSNVDHRKYYVFLDMAFAGFWSFLWFVGFCFLTNQLTRSQPVIPFASYSDCRGAVAFSFFSIISWAIQCYFAVKHYQSGVGNLFATSDDVANHQPYSSGTSDITNASRGSNAYNDDQMIGGDLSAGYQQQHY